MTVHNFQGFINFYKCDLDSLLQDFHKIIRLPLSLYTFHRSNKYYLSIIKQSVVNRYIKEKSLSSNNENKIYFENDFHFIFYIFMYFFLDSFITDNQFKNINRFIYVIFMYPDNVNRNRGCGGYRDLQMLEVFF